MNLDNQIGFKWENRFTNLRKWRLGSFKSVAKPIEIDLAPLTVVVGANSSGKSTLIQSILMMAQNAMRSDERSPAKAQGIFELNGPLVQLGTFKETRCDLTESKSPTLQFGGTWFVGDRDRAIFGRFSSEPSAGLARTSELSLIWDLSLRPVERLLDSGLAVVDQSSVKHCRKETVEEESSVKSSIQRNVDLLKSKYELFSFSHSAKLKNHRTPKEESDETKTSKFQAVSFQAGLPTTGLVRKNIVKYLFDSQSQVLAEAIEEGMTMDPDLTEAELAAGRHKGYLPFIEDYVMQLADYGKRIVQQDRTSEDRNPASLSSSIEQFPLIPFEKFPESILQYFGEANSRSDELEDSTFYLKLIRDLQKRFDELFSEAEWTKEATYCGPNGRRSANPRIASSETPLPRLIRSWNRYLSEKVLYLGPLRVGPRASYGIGSSIENSNLPLGESGEFLAKKLFTDRTLRLYPIVERGQLRDSRMTLEEAVTLWYRELGSSQEANEINVDAPNRQGYPLKIGKRTLANVGFGASQILPVLGLCLSASPGDLILLEQPELHLNPGMQQKLADFLLVMSKTGRQIIVETHSEYLITRLRRNAATTPEDHRYFTIIYVERDLETGTTYRTVSVDDQGDLSEWPKGFFDHVADDLRVLMRRAAERQSGKLDK
jgi:predicted ATPase